MLQAEIISQLAVKKGTHTVLVVFCHYWQSVWRSSRHIGKADFPRCTSCNCFNGAVFWASLPVLFGLAILMRGSEWLFVVIKKHLDFVLSFGLCGITFWFLSVRHIPIGLATSLFQSSVIFITILSPFSLENVLGFLSLVCGYRWAHWCYADH